MQGIAAVIIAEGAPATPYTCGKRHGRVRYFRPMADTDLNLLTALDALLAEGSVVGAARRLGLSASAMSRTLVRLRAATGDPLLEAWCQRHTLPNYGGACVIWHRMLKPYCVRAVASFGSRRVETELHNPLQRGFC